MHDRQLTLNRLEYLMAKGSFNELNRRIDWEQVDKGLIIRHLQYELTLIETVIDQNTRQGSIVYEMQHSLYFSLLNNLAQFMWSKVDFDQLIKLPPTTHLYPQTVPQLRLVTISQYHILRHTHLLTPTVLKTIQLTLPWNIAYLLSKTYTFPIL
jgi:hypothetical protein